MTAFKFDPKEARKPLIGEGTYNAMIIAADVGTSHNGNPMLTLTVKVWAEGKESFVTDRIVRPSGMWKLERLSQILGLGECFESGSVEADELKNKPFVAKVKIQKDAKGKYADQNVIAGYLSSNKEVAPATTKPTREPGDDDLMF